MNPFSDNSVIKAADVLGILSQVLAVTTAIVSVLYFVTNNRVTTLKEAEVKNKHNSLKSEIQEGENKQKALDLALKRAERAQTRMDIELENAKARQNQLGKELAQAVTKQKEAELALARVNEKHLPRKLTDSQKATLWSILGTGVPYLERQVQISWGSSNDSFEYAQEFIEIFERAAWKITAGAVYSDMPAKGINLLVSPNTRKSTVSLKIKEALSSAQIEFSEKVSTQNEGRLVEIFIGDKFVTQ